MSRVIDVALGLVIEDRKQGLGDEAVADFRLLITRRPKNTVYGGYWELPGGKIEPDESPEAAICRELKEELDIFVQPRLALRPVVHSYPHAQVRLFSFFCVRLEGECRNLGVSDHRWIRPEEAKAYRFPEANLTIFQEMSQKWQEATALALAR